MRQGLVCCSKDFEFYLTGREEPLYTRIRFHYEMMATIVGEGLQKGEVGSSLE